MKGKNFLKVCGILMIIFGAIGLISDLVSLFGASASVAALAELGIDMSLGTIVFACILGVVGSIVELLAGIFGIKNCDKPEKAMTCVILGIIVIVLSVVSTVIYWSGVLSVISLIVGLVIPVLYLIGALLNKKAAA